MPAHPRKVNYQVMSDRKCKCGKPLKANLVNRKETAQLCYACFQRERRHRIENQNTLLRARKILGDPDFQM